VNVMLLIKMIAARLPFRGRIPSNSLGVTLIETVVALSIFASAGTAVLLGVSSAHKSSSVVDASAVAENLARNQMEFVWTQDYVDPDDCYVSLDPTVNCKGEYVFDISGPVIDIPNGFSVGAEAEQYVPPDGNNGCIEKVIVTVTRNGEDIHVLETLRAGTGDACS